MATGGRQKSDSNQTAIRQRGPEQSLQVLGAEALLWGSVSQGEVRAGQEGTVAGPEGELEELPRTVRLYMLETLKPSL